MSDAIEHRLHPVQDQFIRATMSRHYRNLFFGGAMGGGKSVALVLCMVLLCKIFPGSRWALVRKDLPRLRRNLIPTFERFVPKKFFYPINKSTWTARAVNGSEILFLAASEKDDPECDRVRGLEINGYGADECNEVSEKFFDILNTRCGRWPCKPMPPILHLYTCNPTQSWPKRKFHDPWSRGIHLDKQFYLPSKVTDNPSLTTEYLEALKSLPPHLYRMLVEGDWAVSDDPDQLIPGLAIEEALNRDPRTDLVLPARLGVDPARFGDDSTALVRTVNYHIADVILRQKLDTQETAALVHRVAREHKILDPNVRVDDVGVGGGVLDALKAFRVDDAEGKTKPAPLRATAFIGGAAAIVDKSKAKSERFVRFRNLRTQAFWHLRALFVDGYVSVDESIGAAVRLKLQGDLAALRYTIDGDRVLAVEAKEQIKKRLGRSPDVGDGTSMAWAEMSRGVIIMSI